MRVFKSTIILNQLTTKEVSALEEDFRAYKSGGVIPVSFGRDELYDHPHTLPLVKTEEIRHIHLADADTSWSSRKIQYSKTSDSHLTYCQGALDNNCYLLIAVLAPDAHSKAKDNNWMFKLGKMAEKFRQQF
jgi:mRNA interferase YafO